MLARILGTPYLAQVVPRLAPEVIHRLIERCGLEACGDLITLATPGQLVRIFDLDLWRAPQPGLDEGFDAARFGVWLEVLVEGGVTVAARKLAEMDVDLVAGGLSRHVAVFDAAAVGGYTTTDGREIAASRSVDDGLGCELAGYLLLARRSDAWDAVIAVLMALDAEQQAFFQRVMARCRALSNSAPEADGFHDLLTHADQAVFELAADRDRRREQSGYLSPAQARAFLQMSRHGRPEHRRTTANPIAGAYFRGIDDPAPVDTASSEPTPAADTLDGSAEEERGGVDASMAEVLSVLRDGGVLPQPPRALLAASPEAASRLRRLHACMQFLLDRDAGAYADSNAELAFLGNAIMAGCSFQGRPWTAEEASDAAVAICNLGLENWEDDGHGEASTDFLVRHDLVGAFQVGWTVLYQEVAMYTAERLAEILASLRCADREIQAGLDILRLEMKRHWRDGAPWRARDALDVMTSLDMVSWAALLALLDECPVLHAAIAASRDPRTRAVDPAAFVFISENNQIASARAFVDSLPDTLRRAAG